MLKLKRSPGASIRGSHPLKGAKGGAPSVVAIQSRKGWASPPIKNINAKIVQTALIREELEQSLREPGLGQTTTRANRTGGS